MIKKTLCFSNRAVLSVSLDQLKIKAYNPQTSEWIETTRSIEDIGVLIIDSPEVILTSALIAKLTENNVAQIFCDSKHMPTGMMLPLDGNTLQSEKFKAQINASQPLKKQLWQQTVSAKIRNQGALLRVANGIEIGNMLAWSASVRSGDPENIEGRAAAYYWKTIFHEYSDFKRDRDEEGVNSLLNYGYAILRAIIARSLVGSGLLPTLGIHHSNKYNAYCLADDIMEPYRPYVDLLVIDMVRNMGLTPEINKETKQQLLTLPTIDVRIKNLNRPLFVAASITTASLAKCYDGESKKILYPDLL